MKNWKTFLAGLLLALPSIVTPLVEKRAPNPEEIVQIIGAVGLGTVAKDKDVTGVGDSARRIKEN
jgi:hypothetical protein